jgi:alkylation response protein AidB-like acyl-CoA dehydrogenase
MVRMMATTVDYMGQRKQFGVTIASFQVLRHRIADMQMTMMKAVALTEVAVLAEGDEPARRAHKVAAACVEVGEAIRFVGENAVQIHGAMGLTEELSLGGLYKRGLAIGTALGPLSAQLARHAATAAA